MIPARPIRVHLGLFWLAVLLAGCGHRGSPVPPLPRLPEPPLQVLWRQRGARLEARAQLSLQRLGGRPLRGRARVQLLSFRAATESLTRGWDSAGRVREFARVAELLDIGLIDPSSDETTLWEELGIPLDHFEEGPAYVIALALADSGGRSLPSARRVWHPATPPLAAPSACRLEAQEDAVVVSWALADEPRGTHVYVYRQLATDRASWLPEHRSDASTFEWSDTDARYDETYVYQVTTATDTGQVVVESVAVACGELAYRDIYPPRLPGELDAVAQSGRIRVFWLSGGSPDEAVVIVERQRQADQLWQKIGRVESPEFFFEDVNVTADEQYRYRARAVDRAGNISEASEPTAWLSPRPVLPEPPASGRATGSTTKPDTRDDRR
ncbi:MAG: hypothetical protein JSV80_09985 [Acidobacteriota bacterium]|nr:MAG: hypothetical protein JSV80_09985 [Acidobacteriota bacterium]